MTGRNNSLERGVRQEQEDPLVVLRPHKQKCCDPWKNMQYNLTLNIICIVVRCLLHIALISNKNSLY